MMAVRRTKPAVFNRIVYVAFYPGTIFGEAAAGPFAFSKAAPKLNRLKRSWIANIAENNFSFAHGFDTTLYSA
jgi:hypothetical protein